MTEPIATGVMDSFFDKWAAEKVAWIADMKTKYWAEHNAIGNNYPACQDHNRLWFLSVGNVILDMLQTKPVYDTPRCKSSIDTLVRREIETRKKDFYAKVQKKVGEITEIDLHLGPDGTPNGLVVGTNGRAVVTTISAGGHNIQCFHYRVLIK